MVSKIKNRKQKSNYWNIQHPKTMVKLNYTRRRLGYFSKLMGENHFFELDLLSGDFIIKTRHFPEIIPNFLWLKDNYSIIFLERKQKKNRWKLRIYNNKTDLVFDYLQLEGNNIELVGLSPNEKEVSIKIQNASKNGLYKINLEDKKLKKITAIQKEKERNLFWGINEKMFFTRMDKKRNKNQSIWCMNADGSNKEPFFDELIGTYEEIIGNTNDRHLLAVNIFDKEVRRSGLLEVATGEMHYLPSSNETLQAVSSTGNEVITFNHKWGEFYHYRTLKGEKWRIPIDDLAENIRFCIDDEFLIYTKYIKNQPIIELFDLVTRERNPIVEMEKRIDKLENKIILI